MPIFLLGDIHGQHDKMMGLLRDAGLVKTSGIWGGKNARLYFLGDYVDRGPDGLDVIDTIMRLQLEAVLTGGRVEALLGNHDVMLLAAHRIGNAMPEGADLPLRLLWQQNGGRRRDLEGMSEERVGWLTDRPALEVVNGTLLMHADSTFYLEYGETVDEVNASFADVLHCNTYDPWATLITDFVRRLEFDERLGGSASAYKEMLHFAGAQRLVHGHTPIPLVARGTGMGSMTSPWVYADGLCTNIDGGMFLGEPGFIYRLDPPKA